MKKLMAIGLLASFVALETIIPAGSASSVSVENGYVSVSTNKTAEVEPNQAVITFSIEARKKELKATTDEINDISARLSEAIKNLLLEEDNVKTSNYSVAPQYYQKDKKKVLLGYRATNRLVVTTKNLKELPNIISMALSNGAMEVSGLQFMLTDYDDKCTALLGEASAQARNDANAIAQSLHSSVSGVKSIHANCGTQSSVRNVMLKAAATAESADSSVAAGEAPRSMPSIEPGVVKINAFVDASFYVK